MPTTTRTREAHAGGIEVVPLDAALGAAVRGIDLSKPLSPERKQAVFEAWIAHLVLVFPGQTLDGPQQMRFAGEFGPIRKRSRPRERRPEVGVDDYDSQMLFISNIVEDGRPIGSLPDGEMWFHHDGCYEERPQRASFLYAIELPATGGNTRFANMYRAYERVPAELRRLLAGKTALHVYDYEMRARYDPERGLDGVKHWSHPVFVTHPDSGRTALYVNRLMTVRINGLPADESADVLETLFALGEDPSGVYEHEWTVGDFVMWDNLCSMHARTDFPADQRRLLRRCVIEGGPIAG